jgi:hypothetical protein
MGPQRFAILLVLLGCRRTPSGGARPDATSHTHDTPRISTASAHDATVPDDNARADATPLLRVDAARTRTRPTRPARSRLGDEGATTLAATTTGGLWVRAVYSERDNTSEVLASVLDARGRLQGEARLLRRTTGLVEALSASVAGEHLWVSWISHLDDRAQAPTNHLTVSVHGRADLTTVDAPITLLDERRRCARDCEYGCWPQETVRAFAGPDGAMLTIATGSSTICSLDPMPARDACPIWHEFRAEPGGAPTRRSQTVLIPPKSPANFVALPSGVFYVVIDGHYVYGASLRWAPFSQRSAADAAAPVYDLSTQADLTLAWTGEHLAARGRPANSAAFADDTESREGLALFDARGASRTRVTTLNGEAIWTPYTLDALRCVAGRPVATVRWRAGGGGTLTLDPARADQHFALEEWIDARSLPLPMRGDASVTSYEGARIEQLVWVGHALMGVVDGALVRWVCTSSGGLALAPDDA